MKIYRFITYFIQKHYTVFCILYTALQAINFQLLFNPGFAFCDLILEILEYFLGELLGV